jgi:hypothetical protein
MALLSHLSIAYCSLLLQLLCCQQQWHTQLRHLYRGRTAAAVLYSAIHVGNCCSAASPLLPLLPLLLLLLLQLLW